MDDVWRILDVWILFLPVSSVCNPRSNGDSSWSVRRLVDEYRKLEQGPNGVKFGLSCFNNCVPDYVWLYDRITSDADWKYSRFDLAASD